MKNKTILVTGAAGFIGSYLCRRLLQDGNTVIGIDNFSNYYSRQAKEFNLDLVRGWVNLKPQNTKSKEIEPVLKLFLNYYNHNPKKSGTGKFIFEELDIRDQEGLQKLFEKYNPTDIIHMAAMAGVGLSLQDPVLYTDVNILGSVSLLDLARNWNVEKFVFASSSSIYGDREEVPFSENDFVDEPVSPYAATKRMQEIMNYTFHHLYKIPIINIRVFGPIFGPLQRPYRMLAQRFINQTFHDQPMTIFGDGKVGARDTTYIDDEIEGIVLALESNLNYETINVGTGRTVTPLEVAEGIKKIMGKGKIEYLVRPAGEVAITYADVKKAKKLLGFTAKTKFINGLEKQIEVYLRMPKWYQDMEC